jgi:lipoprotein-anchoring transpeptidase ErfK/SrfK
MKGAAAHPPLAQGRSTTLSRTFLPSTSGDYGARFRRCHGTLRRPVDCCGNQEISMRTELVRAGFAIGVLTALAPFGLASAAQLDAETINRSEWKAKGAAQETTSPALIKMQVLLDRAHFSPGEIDGKSGENSNKAVRSFARAQGGGQSSTMTAELWQKLNDTFKDPAIVEHRLSEADVKGPFLDKLPAKMEDMKDLPALSYTSVKEKIAEQFHMSPDLLSALNPGQRFDKPGDTIWVANITSDGLPEKVQRIGVDKTTQVMTVFGKSDAVLAVYPVTAGSTEKPAPTGTLKVTSVAKNPTYHYNPDYQFKGVKSQKPFTIQPGPNNPVGLVWIGLNKEGYGIHGTPEPGKVSKAESHGCVRMTNWDALQLASAVSKGIPVAFSGDEQDRAALAEAADRKHPHHKNSRRH